MGDLVGLVGYQLVGPGNKAADCRTAGGPRASAVSLVELGSRRLWGCCLPTCR